MLWGERRSQRHQFHVDSFPSDDVRDISSWWRQTQLADLILLDVIGFKQLIPISLGTRLSKPSLDINCSIISPRYFHLINKVSPFFLPLCYLSRNSHLRGERVFNWLTLDHVVALGPGRQEEGCGRKDLWDSCGLAMITQGPLATQSYWAHGQKTSFSIWKIKGLQEGVIDVSDPKMTVIFYKKIYFLPKTTQLMLV